MRKSIISVEKEISIDLFADKTREKAHQRKGACIHIKNIHYPTLIFLLRGISFGLLVRNMHVVVSASTQNVYKIFDIRTGLRVVNEIENFCVILSISSREKAGNISLFKGFSWKFTKPVSLFIFSQS